MKSLGILPRDTEEKGDQSLEARDEARGRRQRASVGSEEGGLRKSSTTRRYSQTEMATLIKRSPSPRWGSRK